MLTHALQMIRNPEVLPVLLYLLPAGILALVIRSTRRWIYVFAFLTVSATLIHEFLHYAVGAVLGARPTSLSIIPRRSGPERFTLGSVTFANANWFNSAPAALAPFLGIPLILGVAWWRVRAGWEFSVVDLALWTFLAPQMLSCWPSMADWRLATRSWPLLLAPAAAASWYFLQQ